MIISALYGVNKIQSESVFGDIRVWSNLNHRGADGCDIVDGSMESVHDEILAFEDADGG